MAATITLLSLGIVRVGSAIPELITATAGGSYFAIAMLRDCGSLALAQNNNYLNLEPKPYATTHTSTHLQTHTGTHRYVHTRIHTHRIAYLHTFTHTSIHTYIHTYVRTYIHTYIHTCVNTAMHLFSTLTTELSTITRPHPRTAPRLRSQKLKVLMSCAATAVAHAPRLRATD